MTSENLEKECSRCHKKKSLDQFHKDPKGKFGRVAKCKSCIQEERGSTPMKVKPPVQPGNKWCIRCEKEFPLDYFPLDNRASDGHASHCLDCESKAHGYKNRRSYLRDIPFDIPPGTRYCLGCKQIKGQEEFGVMHKPHGRFYRRRCNECRQIEAKERYAENPEYFRDYRNNPDRKAIMQIYGRNYHTKHRSKRLVDFRIWRQKNPVRYKQAILDWRSRNPEKTKRMLVVKSARRRARERDLPNTLTTKEWEYSLAYFNNTCAICGRHPDADYKLAADHWISVAKGGGTTADNIIPLCHTNKSGVTAGCNNLKRDMDGERWVKINFEENSEDILDDIYLYFASV